MMRDEEWSDNQTIEKKLVELVDSNQDNRVSLKDYCQLSELALKASSRFLIRSMEEAEKKNTARTVYKYLCKTNPLLELPPTRKYDQKSKEEAIEAGRRVFQMMGYAWNYYIRMLNGKDKMIVSGITNVYSDQNIQMAKSNIEDMIKQLKNAHYRWENMTKDLMADQETERKQIQEEETFVKMLTNILNSQIAKLIKAQQQKNISSARQSSPKKEPQLETAKNEPKPQLISNEEKPRKNIAQLINLKDYFSLRKQRLQAKQQPRSVMEEKAQKRRFNAAVLRFNLNS